MRFWIENQNWRKELINSMTRLAFEGWVDILDDFEDAGLHPDLTFRLLYRKDGEEFVIYHPFGEVRMRKDSKLPDLMDDITFAYLTSRRRISELPLTEAIALYSEPFRLQAVMECWFDQRIPARKEFNDALSFAWLSSKHLNMPAILHWTGGDDGIFAVEDLLEVFKDNAIVTNDGNIDVPREPIDVFSAGWPSTISWYSSPGDAKANLPGDLDDGPHTMFSATASPDAILAMFNTDSALEFVLDPDLLTDIKPVA